MPFYGVVEDMGMPIDNGEDSLLVVEVTEMGSWFLLYYMVCGGFWEILNEFVVKLDDHLVGVMDDKESIDAL